MSSFQDFISQSLLFDSHCHLNAEQYDNDRDEVVERARKAGLKAIIDIGIDIKSSKKVIENSKKYEIVYASVGIDPENLIPGSDLFDQSLFDLSAEDFAKWLEGKFEELKKLAEYEKVIMIGETGMDNYWLTKSDELDQETKERSLKRQEQLFRMHCKLAKNVNKPLTIHSRNAIEKCLQILQEEKVSPEMVVFHSLTPDIGDTEEKFFSKVNKIINYRYYIGINGIITFKNADLIRSVYKKVFGVYGKRNFLLETDGPFLSPEPYRGKRNEPKNISNILVS